MIGILADLSGKSDQPLPKFKERKFTEIDKDNFDQGFGFHLPAGRVFGRQQAVQKRNQHQRGTPLPHDGRL